MCLGSFNETGEREIIGYNTSRLHLQYMHRNSSYNGSGSTAYNGSSSTVYNDSSNVYNGIIIL